jgi:hypothetical protein
LAASYPTRAAALVLDGCYARFTGAADYPWEVPRETVDRAIAYLARSPELKGVPSKWQLYSVVT